ncbi:MAG: hypothetical protein RLZZ30_130, partial [Bacteroidota bacterium]
MKIALISSFILFRSLIFSQDNLATQITVVKDTMITDAYGLTWNCMLFSDQSFKVSFFGLKHDNILVRNFYSDKTGAFFLKKVLCLRMKIKENEQEVNTQISSNYLHSSHTESYQLYESSSPKNNKLTLSNYCYLIHFFSPYIKNDVFFKSENGLQLGFGVEYELDESKLCSVQLRFNKLPTYQMVLESNYSLDELDFYLYFSFWNQ